MFEKVTHKPDPAPISIRDIRSYRVKLSPNILHDKILLKTRFSADVELKVIISAYDRLPTEIQE